MAHERVKAGIKHFVYGVLYGVLLYVIYVMLFPYIFKGVGIPVGENIGFKGIFLGFLFFFIIIESFASAMKGTVYGFVLKAISKLFGLLVFIYVIGNGVISGSTVISGANVSFSLDIQPIIAAMVLLTFPFIILDVLQIAKEARV
jgi:hypothetical protein